MLRAIEARFIFHDGGIGTAKIPAERLESFCTHIKKVKKNSNDRMLDKSGEFFLKPCVSKDSKLSEHLPGVMIDCNYFPVLEPVRRDLCEIESSRQNPSIFEGRRHTFFLLHPVLE